MKSTNTKTEEEKKNQGGGKDNITNKQLRATCSMSDKNTE